ncbi:MAG: hypothetical protein IJD23_09420 [Spirochaetaceae bacterium]|nr:hypothetical protein [Spirochaetaceae bacterium]MBQ7904467.1 hypothetical protein [Spirochaetaceae bacterium]
MKKFRFLGISLGLLFIVASFISLFFKLWIPSCILSFLGALIISISYIKFVKSLNKITESENQIALGNLTADVLENNEVTATREVLQGTVNNFEKIISLQKHISKEFIEISENLSSTIENKSSLPNETNTILSSILKNLKEINNLISKTNMLSVGISGDIEMLDSQIATQVTMIDNSSEALHEMSSTINQLDKLSAETNRSAELLLSLSNAGKDAVESSSSQIEEIENQANKIEEMVHVIGKISEQTSILAMNAEIEAAHAGDVGKGFAVVADEVRKLAEDSAISSREIGVFVNGIIELIQNASEASAKTTDAFSQIDENINGVCNGVDEITKALTITNQRSHGLLQNIQLVRDISEIISTSSQDVFQNASQISECMNEIRNISNEIERETNDDKSNLNQIYETLESTKSGLTNICELSKKLEESSSDYIIFDHP